MSKVLTKFRVTMLSQFESWANGSKVTAQEVTLAPVQGEPFGPATPSGQIKMVILNSAAASQFHLGSEYYVTFQKDEGLGAE